MIERHRQSLPRIAPIFSMAELEDTSPRGRKNLITKLRRHLREIQRRGRVGHWAYSVATHAAMLRAYDAEKNLLAAAHAAVAAAIAAEQET